MQNVIMTPEVCMRFLVWSYYYHNVVPEKNVSYSKCGKFKPADINRLDELKTTLFLCFEEQSLNNAIAKFRMAKMRNEPCPFTQQELDSMFASEM